MTEHDPERRATLADLMAPDDEKTGGYPVGPGLAAVMDGRAKLYERPADTTGFETLELPNLEPGDVVRVDGELVFAQPLPTSDELEAGEASHQTSVRTETTPVFDELAGDQSHQAKRIHDQLHAEGYKGVRGYEGLKKGLRVRMVGHQFAEAYAHGSGEILGVFRKHESEWESTYNRPDVELLIKLDRPSIADQIVVRAASYGVVIHEDLAPDALADHE